MAKIYDANGLERLPGTTSDHGLLTGLGDDDHTQYTRKDTLTTKGDIYGRSATTVVRKAVGLNGSILSADSVQSDGLAWVTLAALASDLLTTKGDILTRSSVTALRKAVGANNTILAADSAQTDGLDWKTVAALLHTLLTTKGDLLVDTGSAAVRQAVGSNGQGLVADSGQTNGLKWGTPDGANPSLFIGTGTFDTRFTGAVNQVAPTTPAPAINVLRAYPVWIPKTITVDRIAFEVTTAAGAGGKARVGIYSSTSETDPKPAALKVDGGEYNVESTGVKETTISTQLVGPAIYWFCYLCGTSAPTIRGMPAGAVLPLLGMASTFGANLNTCVTRSFSYAALPDPFGTPVEATGNVPLIGVRIASAP